MLGKEVRASQPPCNIIECITCRPYNGVAAGMAAEVVPGGHSSRNLPSRVTVRNESACRRRLAASAFAAMLTDRRRLPYHNNVMLWMV